MRRWRARWRAGNCRSSMVSDPSNATSLAGGRQPIEGEVSELRVDFGPGYRLYFTRRGRVLVVLLVGGTKSTQKRDIRRALKLASELAEDPS
jgi:putative addiction module killer protein